MGSKYNFDYIIIGAGPAGNAAALKLSKTKKRVAIVEGRDASTMFSRDVSYLTSLDFSHTFANFNNSPATRSSAPHCNLPSIVAHQENTVAKVSNYLQKKLKDSGVTYIRGFANFLDKNTIAVGDKKYTSTNFILATGSKLKSTGISGLETVNHFTPETVLKIRRMPKAVLVIGGGATGCEIANYFAELGTKTLILEQSARLLPREDTEVGSAITEFFTKNLGITVLTNSRAVAIEQDEISKKVIFTTGRQEKMVRVDCIVLATGSQPVVDYGLENAGVIYKNSGIEVDKFFQTSAKNIYAIGDCIGAKDSSIERAEYEGNILISNLISRTKNIINETGFIRRVDTSLQVATVGLNEYDLMKRGRKYKKAIIKADDLLVCQIAPQENSFVKILADQSGHIIGAVVVAPKAEFIIQELALAVRHRLSVLEVASTPHIATNFSQAIKLAAIKLVKK